MVRITKTNTKTHSAHVFGYLFEFVFRENYTPEKKNESNKLIGTQMPHMLLLLSNHYSFFVYVYIFENLYQE